MSSAEEHRILHEAIADAFMFILRNDPCLGETICPATSSLCYYEPKRSCLRTADNKLTYTGAEYQQTLAGNIHRRSQLIAGLIWDLFTIDGMDRVYTGDLLYKAISYLPREVNFTDFINALLVADAKLSKGVNACTIVGAVKRRGLSEKLGSVKCESFKS
jgi:hypothetical protein